jgi:CubicO group peptidase (beta-lactamase class C family)
MPKQFNTLPLVIHHQIRICLLIAIVIFSCKQKESKPVTSGLEVKLDSLFGSVADFSGVILVADKGVPVYFKSYGSKDFITGEPLDTASIFELASLSKQFTAMVIMMLKEDGLLGYDDPVEQYIPGLPYRGVTIRHLLNHTSGLPDYQAVMDQHWDKTRVAGNDDNIAYLIRYKPNKLFAPGDRFEYSNTGYMLLASVAEKASGKDFIALSQERIFKPLRMTHTALRTKQEKLLLPGMAWGHLFVADKKQYVHADSFPEFNYTIWLGNRKGPGRVSSTAADLLKWDQALYHYQLIKYETLMEAFSPARLNDGSHSDYGFGWQLNNNVRLGKVVLHTGDNPGYKTMILRYIDSNKTVIALCNNAHEKYDSLCSEVVKALGD